MRYLASALALCTLLSPTLLAQDKAKPTAAALRKQAESAQQEGRWTDAAAAWGQIVEIDAEDARAWHMLGFSRHSTGDLDGALQAHLKAAEFDEVAPVATYNIACVYALKGDKDKAFEYLGKAMDKGFDQIEHMANDPDMDSLRDDPRYAKVVKAYAPKKGALQAYAGATPRQSARVLLWSGDGSPGQMVIDYGQPMWKAEYADAMTSKKLEGRRWRLGANFWTTLDTNVDLEVGGVEVPAGYYYLALERRGEEGVLVLLDPAEVRAAKLDAYLAHKTKGGIEVPLSRAEAGEPAERLEIGMAVDKGERIKGKLFIRFGPHELVTKVAMHVE